MISPWNKLPYHGYPSESPSVASDLRNQINSTDINKGANPSWDKVPPCFKTACKGMEHMFPSAPITGRRAGLAMQWIVCYRFHVAAEMFQWLSYRSQLSFLFDNLGLGKLKQAGCHCLTAATKLLIGFVSISEMRCLKCAGSSVSYQAMMSYLLRAEIACSNLE